jgi:CysZ protein
MLSTAINRSWQQMLHPKFRSVFFTAITAAAITLTLLLFLLNSYWPDSISVGWGWLDKYGDYMSSAGFWFVAGAGSYLLFPGVVTMVMGVLTDKIADAVEEEYYPNRLGHRDVPYGDLIISAAKLALIMLTINLVFLIPYIILLIAGGIGFILLFVAVNGLLLGREYFEMVAIRHMSPREVTALRKSNSGAIFMGGALIAAMFMIPFLNILAPIIGAAVMTHIFHHMADQPTNKVRG